MEDIPPTLREKSTWTPKSNKPISDKLFQERIQLFKKWYAAWSSDQRWELVQFILLRLSDDDLYYIYSLLEPLMPRPIPPEIREDFTRKFPQNISLKIFSYLDARSLCRTAQVSWYWRYLTEQNILWKPKCIRYGWFLPTPPTQYNPLTIWKRHYVNCVSNMYWRLPQVVASPSPPSSPPLSPPPIVSQSNITNIKEKKKRKHVRRYTSPQVINREWKIPSRYPSDLKQTDLFHSPILGTKKHHIPKVQSSATNTHPNTATTEHNTLTLHQPKQSLPLSYRPTVAIDAVIKPPLLEKLRLGHPSNDAILLSTINYPEREDHRTVAATVSRVQSNSPFPSLPPYYQEKEINTVEMEEEQRESFTSRDSETRRIRTRRGNKTETKLSSIEVEREKKGGRENKNEEGNQEIDDDFVRPWREDDFPSDSDSEIF